MRGTHDQHGRVQIDLIEVDPIAFGDGGFTDGAGQRHAPNRLRQAMATLAVLGVATGATMALWPKPEHPEWRVFDNAPVPAAGLTSELVFDEPPGRLLAADLPPPPVDIKPELGYVFGEPGGTVSTRRWATFRTRATSADDAAAATTSAQVDGVDAEVRRTRIRHRISWGPVAGRTWVVTTNNFDQAQSLDFANHVGVVDGKPALAYEYQLAGMQPVGSVAALDCVELLTDLFRGERGSGAAQPTLLTWGTAEAEVSLGSIAAPADALPLVEFVLGTGRPVTIHGLAAIVITSRVLSGPVVAWIEEGRLIMVAGHATADELIALAESVRPATAGEWLRVGLTDLREGSAGAGSPITVVLGNAVTLYRDVNPMTDSAFALTVQVVDGQVIVCFDEQSGSGALGTCDSESGELPLFTTQTSNGLQFVIAIIGRGRPEEAELRIALADGTIQTFPLTEIDPQLPGPAMATLLPTDHGSVELWIGSEVVAALTV